MARVSLEEFKEKLAQGKTGSGGAAVRGPAVFAGCVPRAID